MSGQFPYEYGTHLHRLWAWGNNLMRFLESDHSRGDLDRLLFRPSDGATEAMMHFATSYPEVVRFVHDSLAITEQCYARRNASEQDVENYAAAILTLAERILNAAKHIYDASPPPPDDYEAAILIALSLARGAGTMSRVEICAASGVSDGTAKDRLPKMEAKGWIARNSPRAGFYICPLGKGALNP